MLQLWEDRTHEERVSYPNQDGRRHAAGKQPRAAESSPAVSVARKRKSRGEERVITHRVQDAEMCVTGTVEGVKISWLVDTGSSITILSSRENGKIPRSWRPGLEPCMRKLYQANGGLVNT